MPVISGNAFQFATGTGTEARAVQWQIEYSRPATRVAVGSSVPSLRSLCGLGRWTGYVQGVGQPPLMLPGESYSITGTTETGTNKPSASGTAIVVTWTVAVDYNSNQPVQWRVDYVGDGQLTLGTASITAPSEAEIYCASGTSVTSFDLVRQWQLSLRAEDIAYSDSTASGWERHITGTKDVNVAITVFGDDPADLPPPGDIDQYTFTLATSPNDSVLVKYLRVDSIQWTADRMANEPLSYELRLSYTHYDGTAPGLVDVTLNGLTTHWIT